MDANNVLVAEEVDLQALPPLPSPLDLLTIVPKRRTRKKVELSDKRRRLTEPGRPKRPVSAYVAFIEEKRPEVRARAPTRPHHD